VSSRPAQGGRKLVMKKDENAPARSRKIKIG